MTQLPMDRLEWLCALEDIRVLKARYCRCVDTKDWAGFAALFTADAMLSFPENNPDWVPIGEFLPSVGPALAHGISVHHVHSPEITLMSDSEATGIWAMQDRLYFPPGVESLAGAGRIAGAGHYRETYRRIRDRWLFERIRLTRLHLEVEAQPRTVL